MTSADAVHVAFDKTHRKYMPFPTASDAMLANFLLKKGCGGKDSRVVCQTFDAVMHIICQTDFNRDELTIRSTFDCYSHVAEQRCRTLEADETASLNRSMATAGRQPRGIPSVVLDCTLSLLKGVLDGLATETYYPKGGQLFNRANIVDFRRMTNSPTKFTTILQTLSSMSLVQKSWTLPARRVLGRLMLVSQCSTEGSRSLRQLRNPSFGQWTHSAEFSCRFNKFEAQLFKKLCEGRIENLRSLRVRLETDVIGLPWINTVIDALVALPLLSHVHLDTALPISPNSILPFVKAFSISSQPLNVITFSCLDLRTSSIAVLALTESKLLPIFPHLILISSLKAFQLHTLGLFSNHQLIETISWTRSVIDGRPEFIPDSLELGSGFSGYLENSREDDVERQAARKVLSFAPTLRIPLRLPVGVANALSTATNIRELHVEASGDAETSFLVFPNAPRSLEYLSVHVDLDRLWKAPSAIAQTRATKWVGNWGEAINDFLGESVTRRCPDLRDLRIIFHWSHYPDQENRRTTANLEGEKLAKWQRQIDNLSKKVELEAAPIQHKCNGYEIGFKWDVLFDEPEIQC